MWWKFNFAQKFCLHFHFSSQLLHLFNQLKTEILQSHIMEKTFILVQELLTAAEKSFNLKKYFWKVGFNDESVDDLFFSNFDFVVC